MIKSCEVSTGMLVDYGNPSPDMIDFDDISHSLSMMCRFNGHTYTHYSVAQHSVICSVIAETVYNLDKQHQKWALMHDAAEAYVGDIISPMKAHHLGEYREIEERMTQAVARKFNLWPYREPPVVREIDIRLAKDEKLNLLTGTKNGGVTLEDWGASSYEPLGIKITPLSQPHAKELFIARAKELNII